MRSESLDPRAILDALSISHVTRVESVLGGADTSVWRVEADGQRYALRIMRPEQSVERELSLMRMAQAGGIPTPVIYATAVWRDRPVQLMSWCDGEPLLDALQAYPRRAWSLGSQLGRVQARLHAVPVAADSVRERDQWIAWAGDGEAALQERLAVLPNRSCALLHLDYHPLNVLVNGARIRCVIDWTNARIGDPRADVARTFTLLQVGPIMPDREPPALSLTRRLLTRAWQQGYRQVAGPFDTFDDMALFYAWAGAVMIRDLSPRIGKPGFWLEARHLDRVRRWTEAWKRRAGI